MGEQNLKKYLILFKICSRDAHFLLYFFRYVHEENFTKQKKTNQTNKQTNKQEQTKQINKKQNEQTNKYIKPKNKI